MATILDLPEVRERVFRWTVNEYAKLEDDPCFKHYERIRGFIIDKTSKSPLHMFLTKRLDDLLMQQIQEGWTVRQAGPLRLADSMPEPDVAVVRGQDQDFLLQHPTTAALVVEVAVSSVAADRENATLYAEAGVPEYWIVLGEMKQVEVYRHPVDGIYNERRTYRRGEMIEGIGVSGRAFALDTLFA